MKNKLATIAILVKKKGDQFMTAQPKTAFEMAMAADTYEERVAAYAGRIHELDKQLAVRNEEREDLRKLLLPLLSKKLTVAGRFKITLSHIKGGLVSYQRKPYDSIRIKKLRRLKTRPGLIAALLLSALSVHAQVLRNNPGRQDAIAVQRLPYSVYRTPIEAVPNYGPAYTHDARWLYASTNLAKLEVSLREHSIELGILSRIQNPDADQFARKQQLQTWVRNQQKAQQPLRDTLRSIEAEYELKAYKAKVRPQ